jgi:pimeloyl-ACP methyl ester carboxylesterase
LLHYEEWGQGDPVIALHPLALESAAFAGVAEALAEHGLRTLAVDLPGFGKTPNPDDEPLTPARMAEPVLELARSLERPPLLIGLSMGGRVALEAALMEPELLRGIVLVAPFLPWRRWRIGMECMRRVDPRWAESLRLEKAWPLMKRAANVIESRPDLEHDWLARAAVRFIYYSSCPATRVAFLSAVREMALDPPFGPDGLWTRMRQLDLPTTFLWAGRDALIPRRHHGDVAAALPHAPQIEVGCAGHFVSGAHFRCMRHGIALAVVRTLELEKEREGGEPSGAPGLVTLAPCLVGAPDPEEPPAASPAHAATAREGTA